MNRKPPYTTSKRHPKRKEQEVIFLNVTVKNFPDLKKDMYPDSFPFWERKTEINPYLYPS